jgi:hypothetical protein
MHVLAILYVMAPILILVIVDWRHDFKRNFKKGMKDEKPKKNK